MDKKSYMFRNFIDEFDNVKLELVDTNKKIKYREQNKIILSDDEFMDLELKRKNLLLKIEEFEKEFFDFSIFVISDGIIELRKDIDSSDEKYKNYFIYLCDEKKLVGEVEYNGYHYNEYFGDVGISIKNEYQRNGYGYRALCLLSNLLYDEKIDNFWISAKKDNIASNKLIEKYGSILLKNDIDVNLYIAKTCKINENSNGNLRK